VSPEPAALLDVCDVRFGFPARPAFLGPISLRVEAGECWAIVGPNGAGKSTLMRLMAGLLRAAGGAIALDGAPLATLSPRRRARLAAFVPQAPPDVPPDQTVREFVLLGRFPHRDFALFESPADHHAADAALRTTETAAFADRPLRTLSGGEAQRVYLAAALAQAPRLLLLDEPTSSLDLQHQITMFSLLRNLADDRDMAVVVVTHDVNLAARYSTHVLLMHDGRVAACGPPAEVITPAVLEPVYGLKLTRLCDAAAPHRAWIVPSGEAGQ
jgi:iron complex transport system ATP-binding protein